MPNPKHLSALRWYQSQKYTGAPQQIFVDGYAGVRDGNTAFVNVGNIDRTSGTDKIYTNIFVITFNIGADKSTTDIFGQIITYWKFNTNLYGPTDSGYCSVKAIREGSCFSDTGELKFQKFDAEDDEPAHFINGIVNDGQNKVYLYSGLTTLMSNIYLPIDVNKTYKLSGKFRSVGPAGNSKLYFGFATYDINKRSISAWEIIRNGNPATITNYNSVAKTITVTPALSGWPSAPSIALNRNIGFYFSGDSNHLPNYVWHTPNIDGTASPACIPALGAYDPNYLCTAANFGAYSSANATTINLNDAIPSGVASQIVPNVTKIAAHGSGGNYLYAAASYADVPSTWTSFSAVVTGSDFNSYTKFWPDTKYAKILILPNYNYNPATHSNGYTDGSYQLQFDDLVFATEDCIHDTAGLTAGEVESQFNTFQTVHKSCNSETECGNNSYCTSRKGKLIRDVRRLEDMADLQDMIDEYRGSHGNKCPVIDQGSYVPQHVVSTWPSWKTALGSSFGRVLPIDPINKLGVCDPIDIENSNKFDIATCWDQNRKLFAKEIKSAPPYSMSLPEKSSVYTYVTDKKGENCAFGASSESCIKCFPDGHCEFQTGVCESLTAGTTPPPPPPGQGPKINCNGVYSASAGGAFNGLVTIKSETAFAISSFNIVNASALSASGFVGGRILSPTSGNLYRLSFTKVPNSKSSHDIVILAKDAANNSTQATCRINIGGSCGDANIDTPNEQCETPDAANIFGRGVASTPAVSRSNFQYECQIAQIAGNPLTNPRECKFKGGFCGDGALQSSHNETCDWSGYPVPTPVNSRADYTYKCGSNSDGANACKHILGTSGGYCGDTIIQNSFGENCDWENWSKNSAQAANNTSQYGCNNNCQQVGGYCGDGTINNTPITDNRKSNLLNPGEDCDFATYPSPVATKDSSASHMYRCGTNARGADACKYVDGYCGDGVVQDGTNTTGHDLFNAQEKCDGLNGIAQNPLLSSPTNQYACNSDNPAIKNGSKYSNTLGTCVAEAGAVTTACTNNWWDYEFYFPNGTNSLEIRTSNNSAIPNVTTINNESGTCPANGIQHRLTISIDGVVKLANTCVLAADPATPVTTTINLGNITEGAHKVRIFWDNDINPSWDSNISIHSVKVVSGINCKNGANCSNSCQQYGGYCGDSLVQYEYGEQCDPSITNTTERCQLLSAKGLRNENDTAINCSQLGVAPNFSVTQINSLYTELCQGCQVRCMGDILFPKIDSGCYLDSGDGYDKGLYKCKLQGGIYKVVCDQPAGWAEKAIDYCGKSKTTELMAQSFDVVDVELKGSGSATDPYVYRTCDEICRDWGSQQSKSNMICIGTGIVSSAATYKNVCSGTVDDTGSGCNIAGNTVAINCKTLLFYDAWGSGYGYSYGDYSTNKYSSLASCLADDTKQEFHDIGYKPEFGRAGNLNWWNPANMSNSLLGSLWTKRPCLLLKAGQKISAYNSVYDISITTDTYYRAFYNKTTGSQFCGISASGSNTPVPGVDSEIKYYNKYTTSCFCQQIN